MPDRGLPSSSRAISDSGQSFTCRKMFGGHYMMMAERRLQVEPMAKTTMNGVQRAILSLLEVERLRTASDEELVHRFAQSRDEAAFRVIAERHGPMVLGVCQRALACPHDAEDAFQATFLVFSRRASSLPKAGAPGRWVDRGARRGGNGVLPAQTRPPSRQQALRAEC